MKFSFKPLKDSASSKSDQQYSFIFFSLFFIEQNLFDKTMFSVSEFKLIATFHVYSQWILKTVYLLRAVPVPGYM